MAKDKHSRAAKSTRSSVGAPSQLSQPSRKGKKAWRKNVDIQDVEKGLEEMREEERIDTEKVPDAQLFEIDTKGDEKVRKRFSTSSLTSAKILAQRSAVPAVFSRTTTTASFSKGDTPKRKRVTQAEKDRLLRIAKRPRKGPFGVILDESEDKWAGAAAAQGVSSAVKSSGQYDPWASPSTSDPSFSSPSTSKPPLTDFIRDIVTKPTPKAPTHSQNLEHPHKLISLPAVPAPHAGTSYNPSVDAHQELLRRAVEVEETREEKRVKEGEVKEKMVKARALDTLEGEEQGAPGMVVDKEGETDDKEEEEEEWQGVVKKQTSRKTAQKKKAAKLLAEKRHLAAMAARKRQNAFLSSLSSKVIRRSASSLPTAEEIAARRQAAILARFRNGLAGQKLGKYVVPLDEVDVQLGEDLTETLRGLKASNLFKDRFLNLQQRALIEPRTRVLPKKAKRRVIEYEKHAWKRFDREQNA
ncbi:P60-like protein [Dendrothele bispora CBS 962.96]|uniref:Ribosome biogenesis protein NOP53 n=1 Tax=Dendrothele bispora (strain CBS 962.96) TaxID=1314807 RepID=A0A4V4HCU5_DENBC|nr:P60-like protein [Dendrothele bispora CBS 962.96]